MAYRWVIGLAAAAVLVISVEPSHGQTTGTGASNLSVPAKGLFSVMQEPSLMDAGAIGGYSRGCLAGAQRLATDGPNWQAMRPSRNRHWGHPALLEYLQRLAKDVREQDGWQGLLIGDMSQPRGGPMAGGHKSHQIGLDADIWLRPAAGRKFSRAQRNSLGSISVVRNRHRLNRRNWTEAHARLLRRAASYKEVARIFVHPTIKRELCEWAGGDRDWLRKIRGWYGHDHHFHVRLLCPPDSIDCENQEQPAPGDGCGTELAWWFSDEPYLPSPGKAKSSVLRLGDLPSACQVVAR